MKIIYNNIIPFKGFKCINILGRYSQGKVHTLARRP